MRGFAKYVSICVADGGADTSVASMQMNRAHRAGDGRLCGEGPMGENQEEGWGGAGILYVPGIMMELVPGRSGGGGARGEGRRARPSEWRWCAGDRCARTYYATM